MLRSVLALSALLLVSALAGCAGAGALPADEAALLREDLESAYAEIERLRQRNDDLEFRVRQAMECEAQAARNGERGTTVAVLPTDIFFESGSAELTAQGAARLSEVASRLRAEFPGREIRIEGSTDSMPIGPTLRGQYPSNWELSAARAATVARQLQRAHGFEGRTIEVVGLGEYHPQGSNTTPEGRQQNRRVRIAVMGG
jgi:chemotaxis protein MotB